MNWQQFTYLAVFSISVLLFAGFIRFGPGRHDFASRANLRKAAGSGDEALTAHHARVLEAALVRHVPGSSAENLATTRVALRRIVFVSQRRQRTAKANHLAFEVADAADVKQIRAKLPDILSRVLQ